jgi:hypothetical protein
MGKLNYAATHLIGMAAAAKAFREFALAQTEAAKAQTAKLEAVAALLPPLMTATAAAAAATTTTPTGSKDEARQARRRKSFNSGPSGRTSTVGLDLKNLPIMPTDSAMTDAGRHDMRWALRIHNRAQLAEAAGLADPNAPHPGTRGGTCPGSTSSLARSTLNPA